MRTLLPPFGSWLIQKLVIIGLLLMALTTTTLAQAAPVITTPTPGSTLPTVAVGGSMNITISASVGATPIDGWYECDLINGDAPPCLPPGLTLDYSPGSPSTQLHGSPTTAGTYHFAVSAQDNNGQSGVANYDLVVTSVASTPNLTSVTPSSGSTAGGTPVTLQGTHLSGVFSVRFDGTPASSFTVNNDSTITATTPAHAAGAANVVVTTASGSSTLVNSYTYAPAPTVDPVSAAVNASSSNNPIGLRITGGATSVAVASGANHGTATASGTSITYTPTIGYAGVDAFTYTATNANGTSSPALVSISIASPSINIAPTSVGPFTLGSVFSTTLTASGGTGPYTFALTFGSLPAGLSLSPSGTLSGTPTTASPYNFTVTATDAASFVGSRGYSGTVTSNPPVTSAVSATVAANSSANPITLNLSGGAATSVAVASAASHGTATASGTSITYTPTVGYSGTDSFTYTATNASGTSSPSTVTLTVNAPPITLGPTTLPNGTVSTPYSQTISASGGAAPYTYTITSGTMPTGMSLSTLSGAFSGTPFTVGTYNFTLTATDSNSATGSLAYSITVNGNPPIASAVSATVAANSSANSIALSLSGGAATSVAVASAASHGTATASGTSITYTPTAGYSGADSFTYTATNSSGTSSPATLNLTVSAPTLVLTPASLAAGTAGSPYSATLSASGGTAPYTYNVSGGSLPAGMNLNIASGLLSGTPTTSGSAHLTITVTDANNATGTQAYTFSIAAVPISVPASSQILASGQSATVDLTQGATGGPFTLATLGTVTPASAGRAMMMGPFSMRFVPATAFVGTAIVSFSLQNGSGSSAASSVSFIIEARPDPTKDAEVIGLLNAQTRAAERFASTQMDNFNRRLEQLHQVACNRNSFNASVSKDGHAVPMQELSSAVQKQLGGSANSTDEEKKKAAVAVEDGCKQEAIAYWSDGFINNGSTHARGARDNSFTTLGLSAGVDYRLSPTALAGVGIGYGNDRSDIGDNNTRSDADALGLATYLSLNVAPQVFVDGLLGYNRISFDSRRYITGSNADYAKGSRDADQLFASLTTSYEYRQGPLSLIPYARMNASTTRMDAFRESGGGVYGLSYEEQRQQNFTSFIGLRTGYDVQTRLGVMTPKVGLAWGHNFSGSSDYKMRYTDQGDDGVLYRFKPDPLDSDFANLDLGLDFNLAQAWQLGVSYKTALGSDERSDTLRVGVNGTF